MDQALESLPGPLAPLLTTPSQDVQPQARDLGAELVEAADVSRYSMVVHPSLYHGAQPFAHLGHRAVHAPHKLHFEVLQLGSEPLGNRLTLDSKRPFPRRTATVREAEKVERFRRTLTPLLTSLGRIAAELEQAGLFRV